MSKLLRFDCFKIHYPHTWTSINPQQLDDISVREFQSMLHRNDLFDVWRKLNPETKRYTLN
jgi:hypothetical protein